MRIQGFVLVLGLRALGPWRRYYPQSPIALFKEYTINHDQTFLAPHDLRYTPGLRGIIRKPDRSLRVQTLKLKSL